MKSARGVCPLCGKAMSCRGTKSTLVGYISPVGHNHDDNCRFRDYICEGCGHRESVSKRNRCPVCDWVGKERCFCHFGLKVDKWPEEETMTEELIDKGDHVAESGILKPAYNMSFHNEEKMIGKLDWSEGVLKFTGDAEESAKLLFNFFLKPLIDHYIKKEAKMAEIVVEEGRSTIHCAIMMGRNEESRKAISEHLPFKYKMSCGEVYTLLNITELPEDDLPCSCGNPTHWFVKYAK